MLKRQCILYTRYIFLRGSLLGFTNLVKAESTYWTVVNLLNMQNELMDVYQSDISKMLLSSTSNLVSFMLIKSRHFTWAYHVLLYKISHISCILFFFWFLHAFEVRLFVALLLQVHNFKAPKFKGVML